MIYLFHLISSYKNAKIIRANTFNYLGMYNDRTTFPILHVVKIHLTTESYLNLQNETQRYNANQLIYVYEIFAFFSVNFSCLLVKDNDKFLNQPTARSLLSNAKPRLRFYISIILLLHQFSFFC